METTKINSLVDRLMHCADLWTQRHEAAPTRIGRLVINDGAVMADLAAGKRSVTTATLEKFAGFFAQPANWQVEGEADRAIPEAALSFCHAVGVSAPAAPASAGKADTLSRGEVA